MQTPQLAGTVWEFALCRSAPPPLLLGEILVFPLLPGRDLPWRLSSSALAPASTGPHPHQPAVPLGDPYSTSSTCDSLDTASLPAPAAHPLPF